MAGVPEGVEGCCAAAREPAISSCISESNGEGEFESEDDIGDGPDVSVT